MVLLPIGGAGSNSIGVSAVSAVGWPENDRECLRQRQRGGVIFIDIARQIAAIDIFRNDASVRQNADRAADELANRWR